MFKAKPVPQTRISFVRIIIATVVFMVALTIVGHWSDFMRGYRDGYAWAGSHTGQK